MCILNCLKTHRNIHPINPQLSQTTLYNLYIENTVPAFLLHLAAFAKNALELAHVALDVGFTFQVHRVKGKP